MSKARIILIALAVGVVALIWAATSFTKKIAETPEIYKVGEDFVMALAEQDYDAAAALAVSELQGPESRSALESVATENSDILNAKTEVHFTGRGIDNEIRYASGTVTSGTIESPIYMEFRDENGETRVSFLSFNADDVPDYSNSTVSE
ncbi:MAG TPA: hypothetical protein PLK06_00380 [bacterium]|nr:hypothetical protein [bacterium]